MGEIEKVEDHAMWDFVVQYVNDFESLREQNQSLHNYNFNRQFGLSFNVPQSWPTLDLVLNTIRRSEEWGFKSIVFIYSSKDDYYQVRSMYENGIDLSVEPYCIDWSNIYTAMRRANEDSRYLTNIREKLNQADLVIFFGHNDVTMDVIDQVRSEAHGCLISMNCT